MIIEHAYDEALHSAQPAERLRELMRNRLARGADRDELVKELEQLRQALGQIGREDQEDIVLDVMDFLTGWCSPHMEL